MEASPSSSQRTSHMTTRIRCVLAATTVIALAATPSAALAKHGKDDRVPAPTPQVVVVEPGEAVAPVEVEAAEPVEVEAAEPVEVEAAEPVEVEAAEPIETEATEPIETEATEPIETEATEPIETETV